MTQGSSVVGLFAGIAGIEQGLALAGHHAELLCEADPGARAVLANRMPDVERHPDIRELRSLPVVDIVAGGFPCQDLSQAGRTAGIDGPGRGSWTTRCGWFVVDAARRAGCCSRTSRSCCSSTAVARCGISPSPSRGWATAGRIGWWTPGRSVCRSVGCE